MKKIEVGLFDEEFRLDKLSKKGDPLEEMNKIIKWEIFRPILTKIFKKEAKGPGGRPPYDYVTMFKILILQRLYNLSDEQMEYQINDRLSFMRFLGLSLKVDIPDQNTIWLFRETLTKNKAIKKLFIKFDKYLNKQGIIANKGSIIDATFVEVPRQRNSRDENKIIKTGKIPKEWKKEPKKLSQKDTDARWMTKNKVKHYGYKNHIKIDKKSKIIRTYIATNASVHDSQPIEELLTKNDSHHELYADSAYSGKPIKNILQKRKIKNRIHEKGYRNNPLTNKQKLCNTIKSKTRARVEHIFGFIKGKMKGEFIKSIGFDRAKEIIGLQNLTYNINRYMYLCKA